MVQQIKNNPLFQVGLDVFDPECLVIGGGNESEEKCGRLLDAGAYIQIIAKELTPILKKWVKNGTIRHKTNRFCEDDMENIILSLYIITIFRYSF